MTANQYSMDDAVETLRRFIDHTDFYGPTKKAVDAHEALTSLIEQLEAAQREITVQHATLWLLGLDDHEGEQPTTLDVALDNLRELWRQKSNPAKERQ